MSELNKVKLTDNAEYDLKDDTGTLSDHLHNYDDLVPLISKTFTNVIGSSNNFAGAWFFYGKVQPTDFYDIYQIHYRITSIAAGRSDSKTTCDVWICGTQSALLAYSSFNVIANTGYYAQHNNEFYRATSAGITNQYGHLIGVRLQSSWNPTTAANSRTITVDIIETKNCTFTFFDNMTKYADVPGTGATNYSAYSDLNATSQGLQETGDADNVDSIICYFNLKTGVQGIWQNSLCMEDGNGCYQNICTASNGTATGSNRTTDNTKLANANGFRVGSPIYYVATNYNANTNINGWGAIRTMQGNLFDARWSFNVTLTANSLTPFAPIYLVGTINSTDGLFYLDQTWWTQTPTATDKIYVLVGGCYDSTTTNCRISLLEHNLWYKYDGSKLVELTNGHIVNKDVPANAMFTDHTYESLPESNGGNDVSLVKTGDKWNWNRTFPFKPGLEVASLDDLVGLMDYSTDKRCFSGVIKITTDIGVGVYGWARIIAIAQNAVNNGTYDIGMFCTFFPAGTSDFVNYALIDGKTTGNYSVSKTGKFVTNVFASTVQITTAGNGQLNLGNNLASGATGKSRGRLVIFSNTDTHYSDIRVTGLSNDRNLFCPDKSGTIAVTSDITDEKVKITHSTSNNNYPICFEAHNNTTTYTTGIYKTTKILINPATGDLKLGGSGGLSLPHGGGVSNLTQILRLSASNESDYYVDLAVKENAWCFASAVTKKLRLGSPNYLWTTVYAQTGSINTSDRNEKKDIVPLDETAKDFIMALNPVSYKFKDGESGRTHYGMIAQDVEEEMEELGMTPMDFAGFCKDQKTVPFQDEEGTLKSMPVEGEYTYGLRYEEFIPLCIKTIQMQQQEIDELKQQLAEIKAMLNGGN